MTTPMLEQIEMPPRARALIEEIGSRGFITLRGTGYASARSWVWFDCLEKLRPYCELRIRGGLAKFKFEIAGENSMKGISAAALREMNESRQWSIWTATAKTRRIYGNIESTTIGITDNLAEPFALFASEIIHRKYAEIKEGGNE